MQFLLPIAYLLLFLFLIRKLGFFEVSSISRLQLMGLFGVKLLAASAIWLVYTYYYANSDFLTSMADSSSIVEQLFGGKGQEMSSSFTGSFEDTLFNSSRLMVYINVGLHLFSFGNFYVHALFFCFFSFVGLVALMKIFLVHFPQKQMAIILALFFVPSVLFWGSSALKDSVALGVTGLLIYMTNFGLNKKYSPLQLILIAAMLLFLFYLRLYVLFAILPVLIVNAIVGFTSSRLLWVKYISVIGVFVILFSAVAAINSNYNVLKIISDRQAKAISEAKGGAFLYNDEHFICVGYYEQDKTISRQKDGTYKIIPGSSYMSWPVDNMKDTTVVINSTDTATFHELYAVVPLKSGIELNRVKPTWLDFLLNAPTAFMNTLLHPHMLEISSTMHLVMAVENLWILIFILLAILFFDRSVLQKKEIICFSFMLAATLFILVGITTPSIGAMVRYRIIAVVFLVALSLIAIDGEKLGKFLKRKKQ